MTKEDKFKEKPKIKILKTVSKAEFGLMYVAIATPNVGQPVSIQDWKKKESLYNAITGEAEEVETGLIFSDMESLTLTISEHNDLLKLLDGPVFSNLESARKAEKLVERLKNLEAQEAEGTEGAKVAEPNIES